MKRRFVLGIPSRHCRFGANSVVVTTLLLAASGCSSDGFDNRQRIEGNVRIDGKPLNDALITFIPTGESKGPKATATIESGKYVIEEGQGPLAGEFIVKVEIIPPDVKALADGDMAALHSAGSRKRRVRIAPQYNRDTTLKATVKEDGENRFDFDVKAAKK